MPLVIDKTKVWPGFKYEPHFGQQRIHSSLARHRVNAAGRRFGKSKIGGAELVPEAFRSAKNKDVLLELGIRQEYWIVGPNYTDAEKEFRVFYNACRQLKFPMDRPGTYNDSRSGNMQVSLFKGAFLLQAKSAAHPESLVGEGLHGVIMAEAAKMKASVWSKYIRPTLADFQGWSIWNSTPEGKNHFYEMYQQGQSDLMPEWASWRSPSWMNNFVYRKGMTAAQLRVLKSTSPGMGPRTALEMGADPEVVALFQELGPLLFSQEVECSFSEYAGRVYFDFDEEVHVKDLLYNPDWPLYVATDYGYTNPNVMLFIQIDPFGAVYIIDEYYRNMETDEEFTDSVDHDPILSPLAHKATDLYPDPEDPGASATLAARFKWRIHGGTGGELNNRIRLIRNGLKIQNTHLDFGHPDRIPNMIIGRRCKNLRRELDAYRYPDIKVDGESAEKPLKKDDHAPEALSRFYGSYFGAIARDRPRQRRARVGR